MRKTFVIDAGDAPRLVEAFNRAAADFPGLPVTNLDALHDVLTEHGAGKRIVVTHASKIDSDARRMLEDAMREVPGLTVVFRNGAKK